MKAIVLTGFKRPLRFTDVPTPSVKSDEVLISLKASSLNHHELWSLVEYDPHVNYPVILGSDGAGVVTEVGENVPQAWKGKAVIINPSLDWGDDKMVQSESFNILGYPHQGTFATFISVDLKYIFPKPDHLSFAQAAALPLSGLTSYRALFTRGGLRPGDKVLITGIGGGSAVQALQFALAHSCSAYVTSGAGEKIERAIEMGAAGGVNYTHTGWEKRLEKMTSGFNVIIDSAAGTGFSKLTELAAPGGRIVLFGRTSGAIKDLNPKLIFWKQLSILGTTMGDEDDFHSMIRFVNEHKIVPIIDRIYPLEQIEDAFKRMESKAHFGKIILEH